jgi:hypothetical protein
MIFSTPEISSALFGNEGVEKTHLDILGDIILGSRLCAHLLERDPGSELNEGHLTGLAVDVKDTDCCV